MAHATNPKNYVFNHSMIRVKDPARSIKFYEFLGLSVVRKVENPEARFDLYFLANDGPNATHDGKPVSSREGILELTHNYGTEHDPDYKINNGNEEPFLGLSHIAITVDHMQAACKRIEDAGYKFAKKYDEAPLKNFAFLQDPDGYYVEFIAQNPIPETEHIKETNIERYCLHHTMLRVKDIERSRDWYERVLGMTHIFVYPLPDSSTHPIPYLGANMHFFTYLEGKDIDLDQVLPSMLHVQGFLELGHSPGNENDPKIKYHSGNEEPQGFGHLCIAVDDLDAACERFEELGVKWKKRLTDGRMKNIAFILDPDGYWIEIIQNELYSDKYRV